MHHADQDGCRRVHDLDRLADDAQREQEAVDDPRALQDHHPGVGPNQQAGPERKQDDRHDCAGGLGLYDGEKIRHRVPEDKIDRRGGQT